MLSGMNPDPAKVHHLAVLKEKENFGFRDFIKRRTELSPEEVDALVHELTDRVWAGIDCTACANCCKEVHPTVDEEDMQRLAARRRMSKEQLISEYLQANDDEENPWRTRKKPCPFLKGNRCSVYEDRPADCRKYPYLQEPDFVFRTLGMIERTFTCPIVYEVMERLKRATGYRRGR